MEWTEARVDKLKRLWEDGLSASQIADHLGDVTRNAWPIGNPREPSFHFCGKQASPDRPYCEDHCAMAYRRKSDNAA